MTKRRVYKLMMMMTPKNKNNHEGFIPLFRRFLDSDLWTEKRKFSRAEAWIDLLFMARYSKEPEKIIDRGEVITIGYGEILTSVKSLAKRWGRSETWVRALLEHLESKGSIKKHTKKNRRTIISIINLGYFQELVKKRSTEKLTEKAQKKHRKSHKNKDNKENISNNTNRSKTNGGSKTSFGNEKVNYILALFKDRYGFPPTDSYPRRVAWNLTQRIDSYIKSWDRDCENMVFFKRAAIKLFDDILSEKWGENVQNLATIKRKMPIYLKAKEVKK